jgi:SPP1 family predicted phage head-tail adaptor
LNPGKRDRKITIEKPTYTTSTDTNDRPVTSWSTYRIAWAEMVHKQSQEVFESGQMVAKDTFQWSILYSDAPALKMDMRISYDSKYFYLVGMKELGRKEYWQITAINRDN